MKGKIPKACIGDARGKEGKQERKSDGGNADGNKKGVMRKSREDRSQQRRNNSGKN